MKCTYIFILLLSLVFIAHCRTNFVIFLADDLGFGDLGCFGNTSIKTPHIDKLAEQGVKLTHHVAAAAVCTPSRAALLTGRYPIRAGMESSNRNKVFFFVAASGGLPETEMTFAKILQKEGYATAIIGKWHLGNDHHFRGDAEHHPLNHGFDYFYGLPLSNFKDFGTDGQSVITTYVPLFYSYVCAIMLCGTATTFIVCGRHRSFALLVFVVFVLLPALLSLFLLNLKVINGVLMRNKDVIEQPLHLDGLTQRFVREVKHFLIDNGRRPFLIYVPFVHVHTALFCDAEFRGRSCHGRYGDNVEEMDWAVGEVMDQLRELDVLNNTFVYFSSDNGAHIEEVSPEGERQGGYNGILRGGKMMGGMEGGIRVPGIISWPGRTVPKEIPILTSQMDLFPTLLEVAGVNALPRKRLDGRSLVPLLHGHRDQTHHQILFHYCGKDIHAATYVAEGGHSTWKVHWITPKFVEGTQHCEYVCHCFGKFVVQHSPPLMYELSRDPSESRPLDTRLPVHRAILDQVEEARAHHTAGVLEGPDQFNFWNTVWKPWLQPCCNFPTCHCREEKGPQ